MSLDEIRRRVSIIEIAEHYGYQLQKGSGTRMPAMKNEQTDDKIIIVNPTDPQNQGYFSVRNQSDKGNLWNFVKFRIEMGMIPNRTPFSVTGELNRCVMNTLLDYLNIPMEERQQSQERIAQMQKNQETKVTDFTPYFSPLEHIGFLQARGFSEKVLADPILTGRIGNVTGTQDIALPIFDAEGKMVGLEKRNKSTKLYVAGSQKGIGVWHSNVPDSIERVLITESPLDCIAHHQMMPNPHTLYIAHGGNLCKGQIETINTLLHNIKGKVNLKKFQFMLGADNDLAGTGYDLAFIKNQMSMKGMRVESSSNQSTKGITIHEGAFVGFQSFCDNFARNLKNKEINYLLRTTDEGSYLKITYPAADMKQERELCETILSTGLLPFTCLEKAVLKDWNDDLKQIKEVSREAKRYITHEEFAALNKNKGEENIISNKKPKRLKL